jgi:serine/threonine protein kinase/formylglycine-generating enzyme required for sulfatase activity
MSDQSGLSENREGRLAEILDGYWKDLQEGKPAKREDLLNAHPELRNELNVCLSNLDFIGVSAKTDDTETQKRSQLEEDFAESESNQGTGHVLGDYRIIREIGRGGMGVVYEAEQLSLRRRIALKVLPFASAMAKEQLDRFRLEAQAAASLKHPNIVPVYAIDSEKDIHYYTMQFIEGHTLQELVLHQRHKSGLHVNVPSQHEERDNVELSVGQETRVESCSADGSTVNGISTDDTDSKSIDAHGTLWNEPSCRSKSYVTTIARLGIQTAEALHHAHQAGIVHRDIKPSNLIVDRDNNAWVTDFGLALFTNEPGMTLTGEVVGTLRYMSPEQSSGRRGVTDHRSDIYSLGVTLYELFTLEPAIPGQDRVALLRNLAFEDPRRPRLVNKVISTDLETIILKAIAKEPQGRYLTARELADDLRRFLEDRPILARRPSVAEVAAKWAKRHKPIVAVSSIVVIAVCVVLGMWLQGRQHERAMRAGALTALVMDSEVIHLPEVLLEVENNREWTNPLLEQIHGEPNTTQEARLRLSLALLPTDPARFIGPLKTAVLDDTDLELTVLIAKRMRRHLTNEQFQAFIEELVAVHRTQSIATNDNTETNEKPKEVAANNTESNKADTQGIGDPEAQNVDQAEDTEFDDDSPTVSKKDSVLQEAADADRRFRSALVLSIYEQIELLSPEELGQVAKHLVSTVSRNASQLPVLTDAFKPAGDRLNESLTEIYLDSKQVEIDRVSAARILAGYKADDPQAIAMLIRDATPDQFKLLFQQLDSSDADAIQFLKSELKRSLRLRWNDAQIDKPDPSMEAVNMVSKAGGILHERFALVQTLPLDQLERACRLLESAGYSPVTIRPFAHQNTVLASAVWHRDGVKTDFVKNLLNTDEISQRKRAFEEQGYLLSDLSGYQDGDSIRYLALWRETTVRELKIVVGRNNKQLEDEIDRLVSEEFRPRTQMTFLNSNRQLEYCAIWEPNPTEHTSLHQISLPALGYYGFEHYEDSVKQSSQQAQSKNPFNTDLSVIPTPDVVTPDEEIRLANQALEVKPDDKRQLFRRAQAQLVLGNYQAAIDDLLKQDPDFDESYMLLARAYAWLGQEEKAREAKATYLRIGAGVSEKQFVSVVVDVHFGRHKEGLREFENLLDLNVRQTTRYEYLLFYAACAYCEASIVVEDKDLATKYSHRAVDLIGQLIATYLGHGNHHCEEILTDHRLDPIRKDTIFQQHIDLLHLDRRYSAVWQRNDRFESRELHGRDSAGHLIDCNNLAAMGYRPRLASATSLAPRKGLVTASIWYRPRDAENRNQLVKRKTNAAVALYRLGQAKSLWSLLQVDTDSEHGCEPSLRNSLIHALAESDATPDALVQKFQKIKLASDPTLVQALILAMGEFDSAAIDKFKPDVVRQLAYLRKNDPRLSVQSAVEWLRRTWRLKHLTASDDVQKESQLVETDLPERNWFETSQGHTMAILDAGKFRMGSPISEQHRFRNELLHERTIGRRFAIATTEVTNRQFAEFRKPDKAYTSTDPNKPRGEVSWYAAAGYCNWLSEQEGLPEDEWCYQPNADGEYAEGMKLVQGYLTRQGYRLPSEAEWEFACRAGTSTVWNFGQSPKLLRKYAWIYSGIKDESAHRVGLKKPNLFGLFDMHGNVYEWCQESTETYPFDPGKATAVDVEEKRLFIKSATSRQVRGGSVTNSYSFTRSADRNHDPPNAAHSNFGFRVAKTMAKDHDGAKDRKTTQPVSNRGAQPRP